MPGVGPHTVYTLFAECGRDPSAVPSAGDFASWLGLCPDNRITGGKIISARTRKVPNPTATALRLAAQSLHRNDSVLGDFYRRMPDPGRNGTAEPLGVRWSHSVEIMEDG